MIPTLFVRTPSKGRCWICGSPTAFSREHKIKATDLRRHFGKGELRVGSIDDGFSSGRIAQGIKSDHLKFNNPICEQCNSSVTQESDRAYDNFISQLENGDVDADSVYRIFSSPRSCE